MARKKATENERVLKEKSYARRRWAADEIAYLIANFKRRTARQIAGGLNRTVSAVRAKAVFLGLRKPVAERKGRKMRSIKKSGRSRRISRKKAREAAKVK